MKFPDIFSRFRAGKEMEMVNLQPEQVHEDKRHFIVPLPEDFYNEVIIPLASDYKTTPDKTIKQMFFGGCLIAAYGHGRFKLPGENYYRELSDYLPIEPEVHGKIIYVDFTRPRRQTPAE